MKTVSGKEFAKLLEKKGWILRRTKGSHHIYVNEGNPARISLPIHSNQTLKVGLTKANYDTRQLASIRVSGIFRYEN